MYKSKEHSDSSHVDNSSSPEQTSTTKITNQQDYLKDCDINKNGHIYEQSWAKSSMNKFHKSVEFFISHCTICKEAWPLKSKPNQDHLIVIYAHDVLEMRNLLKSFHLKMLIPSAVPHELQSSTQFEEMLIARVLPIMKVYIKSGEQ